MQLVPITDENISGHAHKTVSWYSLGVVFKISDKHPRPFYMRVPSGRTRSLFLLVFLPTSYWYPTTYVVYLTWLYLQMCFVYRLNFFEYETVHQIAK